LLSVGLGICCLVLEGVLFLSSLMRRLVKGFLLRRLFLGNLGLVLCRMVLGRTP